MRFLAFVMVLFGGVAVLAQSPQSAGNAEHGKKQYIRAGCWECHGYAGQGGRDGARLSDTALSSAQLTRYVRRPSGAMPAYIDKVMTDQELADIWAYLKTMTGPKTAKDVPLLMELKGQ